MSDEDPPLNTLWFVFKIVESLQCILKSCMTEKGLTNYYWSLYLEVQKKVKVQLLNEGD